MKLTTLIFAALTCPALCVAGQLYKTIDADGNPVYTDQPLPNAVPVNISPSNSNVMPATKVAALNNKKSTAKTPQYQVTIVSPANKQTVRNNSGNVNITASITSQANQPKFKGMVQLFLDGKLVQQQHSLQFSLKNLDRGEHKINLKLVTSSGKVIALSPESIFYLHQASVLTRAN